MGTKRAGLTHVATVVGILGLGLAGMLGWEAITDRVSPGSLRRAVVTSAGVLGFTAIRHSGKGGGHSDWRLILTDPVTGVRRGRRITGSAEPACEEAQAGFLWCRTKTEITLLALPNLDERATWADLRRKIPALESGITDGPLVRSGTSVVVRANDGRDFLLEADPLGGTPAVGNPPADTVPHTAPEEAATIRSGTLRFKDAEGSKRSVVVLETPEETRATTCKETYLGASFTHPRAPDVSSSEGSRETSNDAFVVHKTSLSREQSRTLLSRLGEDGCAQWTADLGEGMVQLTIHTGGVVAVVGNFPRGEGKAIGLDEATGKERWRSPF